MSSYAHHYWWGFLLLVEIFLHFFGEISAGGGAPAGLPLDVGRATIVRIFMFVVRTTPNSASQGRCVELGGGVWGRSP